MRNNFQIIICSFLAVAILIAIGLFAEKSNTDEATGTEAQIHWTENEYYEGMIEVDPNWIPAVRDDPDIRAAVRKHQIKLRDTGPGFYFGEIDGRIGGESRDAYNAYGVWYMEKSLEGNAQ